MVCIDGGDFINIAIAVMADVLCRCDGRFQPVFIPNAMKSSKRSRSVPCGWRRRFLLLGIRALGPGSFSQASKQPRMLAGGLANQFFRFFDGHRPNRWLDARRRFRHRLCPSDDRVFGHETISFPHYRSRNGSAGTWIGRRPLDPHVRSETLDAIRSGMSAKLPPVASEASRP